jgi:hypothetical protein
LRRIGLPYPDYARVNEAIGIGSKKQAHELARGKRDVGLQSHAMKGEINGSREVSGLVTLDHKRHRYADLLTLRPALI